MDSETLQRGDKICLTRAEFYAMWTMMATRAVINNKTKQQVLYQAGLKELQTMHFAVDGSCFLVCAVIYPKRYMMMKLRHGF